PLAHRPLHPSPTRRSSDLPASVPALTKVSPAGARSTVSALAVPVAPSASPSAKIREQRINSSPLSVIWFLSCRCNLRRDLDHEGGVLAGPLAGVVDRAVGAGGVDGEAVDA